MPVGSARTARPHRHAATRSDAPARRTAALLVSLTLLHGLALGLLLTPGSLNPGLRLPGNLAAGLRLPAWLARAAPVAPPQPASWAATGPGAGVPGAALPGGVVPGGPTPLPAETALRPVGLSIPAIGVEEPRLVPLGRASDGSMEVPEDFDRAGWFTGGSVPGAPGPAIIAGHVDSFAGPAVFFRLRELRSGDTVTVTLDDGSRVRYVVDGVRRYPKTDFPTQTVFGPTPGVALRLITCGGSFDRAARSYRDNVVVYATRQEPAG